MLFFLYRLLMIPWALVFKRLLFISAVSLAALAGAILAAGWFLARPVPVHIGSSPADLDAQGVSLPE